MLFVWHERRTEDPLVRLKLMADKGILESNVVAIFVGLSMFLMFQTLPFFLMSPESLGGFALASAFVVGLYMFPSAGAQLFTGPLGGVFSRRRGADWTLSLGLGIFLLGFALLIFMHSSTLEIVLAVFVSGSGPGFNMVGLINLIVNGCPQQEFGVASGMNSLFRVIGGSIGPVLGGVIMAQFTVDWIPPGAPSEMAVQLTTETGYVWAWVVGAVFAFIGLILSLIIRPESNSLASGDDGYPRWA